MGSINPFSFRSLFSQLIEVSRFSDCGHDGDGDFSIGNTCAKKDVHGTDEDKLDRYLVELISAREEKNNLISTKGWRKKFRDLMKREQYYDNEIKKLVDSGLKIDQSRYDRAQKEYTKQKYEIRHM